ncbi:YafY family transcriptional regulator [Gordonia otitidis]|uniref:helix-turn-helix transcriptional regulator n=1 Tax=Gordonia otitidis TaxID=249058 RepID=UPI001D15C745|nr:YafY family protein [Gordonia otitidis]UEA61075.1 YafY family transcriptional regulator [Gordonia otitidis]
MTAPVSRMLMLLELLQSSGVRKRGELAERLDVDERTVRRYVAQLRELGIPVESVRGRNGGYRVSAGYRMPPLMLSDDEAVAVTLGLLRAQSTDLSSDTAVHTALSKLRRALPPHAAARVDALLHTAIFAGERTPEVADAEVLLTIADAVAHRRPLAITYRGASASRTAQPGAMQRRTVHPYDLIAYRGHWYMVGLDLRRGAERTFRVDRVQTIRTLDGEYTSRPFRDERGPLDLAHRFATAERAWQVSLRIQADEDSIRAHLPASVALVERLSTDDGEIWCRASISAERLEWIPSVLVGLGCAFVIESPEELRRVVDDAAERLRESARR